jgi:hypothetical protein
MAKAEKKAYVVSRQLSWPDGILYVELETGGEDCPSPGMLGGKGYRGEETFDDPRDAAKALIAVRDAWQADHKPDDSTDQTTILVSIGTTGGGLFSHEPEEMTDEKILAWGEKTYEQLPKCDNCGEVRFEEWHLADDPDAGDFCSERCCDRVAYNNATVVIENRDEWSWWNEDDKGWVEDPADATWYARIELEKDDPRGIIVALEDATESFEREIMAEMPDPPTPL